MRPTASILDLRNPRIIPVFLSVVAGCVDSCTFLGLFGLFVAQVTGSFVVTGAQLVAHDPGFLIKILGIPFFLLGGILTTIIVAVGRERGGATYSWSFGLEAILLVCFLVIGVSASPFRSPNGVTELATAFFGLSAMGVQSAQVRLVLKGVASTNVMTTNTTLIAIEATETALAWWRIRTSDAESDGLARFTAARGRLMQLISIALGFLAGTVLGALTYQLIGFWSLVLPTAIVVSLALWATFSQPAGLQPAT
ncbi:MAG: DUF1275 domain-containing protein [Bradyrhizobiaceae bacterium]|nr:DUF1275 domain-containing protein [Bradyrhizobiaceae bacterium]